jgi:hypothetical protein
VLRRITKGDDEMGLFYYYFYYYYYYTTAYYAILLLLSILQHIYTIALGISPDHKTSHIASDLDDTFGAFSAS